MRASAQDIHLFVNGRPVRERVLLSAVREAYRDALPSGKHPKPSQRKFPFKRLRLYPH